MKNLAFSILFFFLAVSLNAQVAIGKTEISSNFVSLEFGNEVGKPEKQKGLLLPWVIEAKEVNTIMERSHLQYQWKGGYFCSR